MAEGAMPLLPDHPGDDGEAFVRVRRLVGHGFSLSVILSLASVFRLFSVTPFVLCS